MAVAIFRLYETPKEEDLCILAKGFRSWGLWGAGGPKTLG